MSLPPFEMPQPIGLYAGDLLNWSRDYFEAFERLSHSEGRELSFPLYFLLAHGTELLLKSNLAASGVGKKTLLKYGHRLREIYDASDVQTLSKVEHLDHLVFQLAEMNSEHDFRYPMGYNLTMPRPLECLKVVKDWQATVTPGIEQRVFAARLEHMDATQHLAPRKIRWSD